jgi:hypothetical protein
MICSSRYCTVISSKGCSAESKTLLLLHFLLAYKQPTKKLHCNMACCTLCVHQEPQTTTFRTSLGRNKAACLLRLANTQTRPGACASISDTPAAYAIGCLTCHWAAPCIPTSSWKQTASSPINVWRADNKAESLLCHPLQCTISDAADRQLMTSPINNHTQHTTACRFCAATFLQSGRQQHPS